MKLYLDDVRPCPEGFALTHSVNEAKRLIESWEEDGKIIELLDLDHDLGDYARDGGDAINLLDWLVERQTLYPVSLHTSNVVGRENMQRILDRWWPISELVVCDDEESASSVDADEVIQGGPEFLASVVLRQSEEDPEVFFSNLTEGEFELALRSVFQSAFGGVGGFSPFNKGHHEIRRRIAAQMCYQAGEDGFVRVGTGTASVLEQVGARVERLDAGDDAK